MRLSDLINLANSLLDECNAILKQATGKEWLIIGEDFDKAGIPTDCIENLFVTYSNIFRSMRAHMIFVIPIALGYSPKAGQFHVGNEQLHILPDTPVYKRDHTPHREGRHAIRAVLEARMSLDLFCRGQVERLIVASGGNIRDLFSLVSIASDLAILDKEALVGKKHVDAAIKELRTEYERRLGENPFERPPVTYTDKAKRLVSIYNEEPAADVPDPALYSLLRSRAVQEFNGERWFGIHPLIVDILALHKHILPKENGTVAGGTI